MYGTEKYGTTCYGDLILNRLLSYYGSGGGVVGGSGDPSSLLNIIMSGGGVGGGVTEFSSSLSLIPTGGGVIGGESYWTKLISVISINGIEAGGAAKVFIINLRSPVSGNWQKKVGVDGAWIPKSPVSGGWRKKRIEE